MTSSIRQKVFKSLLATTLATTFWPVSPAAANEGCETNTSSLHSHEHAVQKDSDTVISSKPFNSDWKYIGSCAWTIDGDGNVTVIPCDGNTGVINSISSKNDNSWTNDKWARSVRSVTISGSIKILDASGMFAGCINLESIDLSGLDTTDAKSTRAMFSSCNSLESIDLSGMDTSNVKDMSYMFYKCSGLKSIDLSGMDTSNVTDMSYMFQDCFSYYNSLKLDLSSFDISNVTSMTKMFDGCWAESLDLFSFGTSKMTSTSHLFENCHARSIDLSSFDTSNVKDMSYMFRKCDAESLDLSSFDTSNVKDMSYMFSNCKAQSLDLSSFDTSNVKDMSRMFTSCVIKSLDLSSFDTSNVKYMSNMFSGCETQSLDLSSFDTSNVTSMSSMFYKCEAQSLDLSSFDTSNVTSMSNMFSCCCTRSSLNLSSFNTSNVTDMSYMFENCLISSDGHLGFLDLSSFNTLNVSNMEEMFKGCAIETLDISSFRTTKNTNMENFFSDETSALKEIIISDKFYSPSGQVFFPTPRGDNLTGKWLGPGAAYWSIPSNYGGHYIAQHNGEEPDWGEVGTCQWLLDSNGKLTVKPLNEQEIAALPNWQDYSQVPWHSLGNSIEEIEFTGNIKTAEPKYLFSGSSIKFADLRGLDTTEAASKSEVFSGCQHLEKIIVGRNFVVDSFTGAGTTIHNATSNWVDVNTGTVYEPTAVPTGIETTYLAQLKLDEASFKIDLNEEYYEEKPITKEIETDLVEGQDFTVAYSNNTQPGTAKITISGIGRYIGSLEYQFEIIEAPEPDPDPKPDPDTPGTTTSVTRLAGEEAADTSAKIAQAAFPEGSEWVVVARDDDFADAMSATGLAGTLGCPIVLTSRYGLSKAAADAVYALGASKAYVIGGKGAIPANLEDELDSVGCTEVKRVFGEESWDTSVACAEKIAEHGGNPNGDAIVAMSSNFQDALSISSFAYKYQVPIYLETSGDDRKLPAAARKAIKKLGGTVYVPGGPGAVPTDSVEGAFPGKKVERIYGEDGYDTSNQIATYMVEHNLLSASTVCVASGAPDPKGVDALAGAALAGRAGGVMLLANDNAAFGEVDSTTIDGGDSTGAQAFLSSHAGDVNQAYLLGGKAVVGAELQQKVNELLG